MAPMNSEATFQSSLWEDIWLPFSRLSTFAKGTSFPTGAYANSTIYTSKGGIIRELRSLIYSWYLK